MCEFQIVKPNELPMCEYTNDICTYCVCGNSNTYNEAKKRRDNPAKQTKEISERDKAIRRLKKRFDI